MLRSGARLVPPALAAAFIVAAGACGKKSGGGLGPPCRTAARSAQILACLNGTLATGPDACLAKVGGTPCDQDRDEVDDDLEDALGLAYAPVLAMNAGAYGGDPENSWPANVTDFTAHSQLIFRRTGDTGLVDAAPTLDSLPDATYVSAGKKRYANRPDKSDGQYFWVCLLDTSAAARVTTSSAMLAAPNGVDLPSVVHPANGTLADSSDYFIAYPFFWAFNEFTMDEHEGDWETIALFVNRQTGAVDDFYSARHKTTDSAFVDLSLTSAIDPAAEVVSRRSSAPRRLRRTGSASGTTPARAITPWPTSAWAATRCTTIPATPRSSPTRASSITTAATARSSSPGRARSFPAGPPPPPRPRRA